MREVYEQYKYETYISTYHTKYQYKTRINTVSTNGEWPD